MPDAISGPRHALVCVSAWPEVMIPPRAFLSRIRCDDMGHNGQSHGMPMNKLYLMIAVMIGANPINPPAKADTIYLPKIKFNEKVDRAHAE